MAAGLIQTFGLCSLKAPAQKESLPNDELLAVCLYMQCWDFRELLRLYRRFQKATDSLSSMLPSCDTLLHLKIEPIRYGCIRDHDTPEDELCQKLPRLIIDSQLLRKLRNRSLTTDSEILLFSTFTEL